MADGYCITNGKRYHFLYDSLIFRFYGQQGEKRRRRRREKNGNIENLANGIGCVAYAKAQWENYEEKEHQMPKNTTPFTF